MNMKKLYSILPVAGMLLFSACNSDFLDRGPSDQLTEDILLNSTAGGKMLLNGTIRRTYLGTQIYATQGQFGQKSVDIMTEMLGEDYFTWDGYWGYYEGWYAWQAHRMAADTDNEFVWSYYYDIIDNMNILLKNVDHLQGEQAERDNLKGQAKAFRANSYFKLVQLYAARYRPGEDNSQPGIPVYTKPTDIGKARSSVEDVYKQINADLDSAMLLLTPEREHISHINLNVAQAFKAEVLLTMGKYGEAANMAHQARSGYALMDQAAFKSGFNNVSNVEWMWGVKIKTDQATVYGSYFAHTDPCSYGYDEMGNEKRINTGLYDAMGGHDVRKAVCYGADGGTRTNQHGTFELPPYTVDKFQLPSYSTWAADYCYMRAAEMYLIEAEGLARSGSEQKAADVLFELVSQRDPDYVKPIATGQALIDEILLQRRIELLGEGFRFFDLKRLNQGLDRNGKGHDPTFTKPAVVPAGDPGWQFLIPTQEMNSNPLMKQND